MKNWSQYLLKKILIVISDWCLARIGIAENLNACSPVYVIIMKLKLLENLSDPYQWESLPFWFQSFVAESNIVNGTWTRMSTSDNYPPPEQVLEMTGIDCYCSPSVPITMHTVLSQIVLCRLHRVSCDSYSMSDDTISTNLFDFSFPNPQEIFLSKLLISHYAHYWLMIFICSRLKVTVVSTTQQPGKQQTKRS